MKKSAGCGIFVKKERECGIRTPPSRPCFNIHLPTSVFRCAVRNEPITTDADRCLFHVISMEMSSKGHASVL